MSCERRCVNAEVDEEYQIMREDMPIVLANDPILYRYPYA